MLTMAMSSRVKTDALPSADQAVGHYHPWRWVLSILFTLIFFRACWGFISNDNMQWHVVWQYLLHPTVLRGLMMTLLLTAVSMAVGYSLGTALALCRMSRILPLQAFAIWFIWLFRSVPTLVMLIFLYNAALLIPEVRIAIPFGPELWSVDTNRLVTPFVAAVIGLGFHKAAYMSEIIRAGFLSIDEGQRQAAKALGMSQTTTFLRIVLPQSMRVIIPPTGSEIISTLKLTSLVSVISMSEMLYSVETIYSRTFQTIPLLLVACIWYLVLTSLLQLGQRYVERYFRRGYETSSAGTIARTEG